MIGNRVLLKWREPQYARKYEIKQLTAKDYLIAYGKFIWKWTVGTFVAFSFLRWISPKEVNSYFDTELISVVLFITVFATLLWLIYAAAISVTAEVSLREKDITYMAVSGAAILPYKEIQSCSIVNNRIDEKEYSILEIKKWNGDTGFIEIDPKINIEDITEILGSKNIQIKPSLIKLV